MRLCPLFLLVAACHSNESRAPVVLSHDAAPIQAPTTLPDYPGPAGLTWGISGKDVRASLSAKYQFDREVRDGSRLVSLVFSGQTFGGLPLDNFVTELCDDRFASMFVFLRGDDERPIYRRWLDVVAVTSEKYGPPAELVEPESAHDPQSSDRLIDMDVRDDLVAERGVLRATWYFDKGRAIEVRVRVGAPNSFGRRSLLVVWVFADSVLVSQCDPKPQSDF